MRNLIIICIIAISVGFCFPIVSLVNAEQEASLDDQISLAINQLHSSNGKLRKQAKVTLLRLGSISIKPLLDLLNDIRANLRPRYETGKEREGAEFIEQYNALPMDQQDYEKYLRVDTSQRLKRDAIELLGRLKAQEAIPTLILLLEERIAVSPKDISYPESRALIEIGAMSVPALIEALKIAEGRATDRQASVVCSRLAFVLGEIGDTRALPVLEKVLSRNGLLFGVDYIEDAIKKIKDGNNRQ